MPRPCRILAGWITWGSVLSGTAPRALGVCVKRIRWLVELGIVRVLVGPESARCGGPGPRPDLSPPGVRAAAQTTVLVPGYSSKSIRNPLYGSSALTPFHGAQTTVFVPGFYSKSVECCYRLRGSFERQTVESIFQVRRLAQFDFNCMRTHVACTGNVVTVFCNPACLTGHAESDAVQLSA